YRAIVVQGLYGSLLSRPVDPAGLSSWVAFLGRGGTSEGLQAMLLGSDEYFRRNGSNNTALVQALYRDVLQRLPDDGGARFWNQILINGAPRSSVAGAILGSLESDRLEVDSLYRQYLRRGADSAGLMTFTGALQSGVANELVLAVLAGSDEYLARL